MPVCTHLPRSVHTFALPKFIRDHMACTRCAKKKCEENFMYRGVATETILVMDERTIEMLREHIGQMQDRFERDTDAGTAHWDTTPAQKEDFEFVAFERVNKRAKRVRYRNFNYGVRKEAEVRGPGPKHHRWKIYHFAGAF